MFVIVIYIMNTATKTTLLGSNTWINKIVLYSNTVIHYFALIYTISMRGLTCCAHESMEVLGNTNGLRL